MKSRAIAIICSTLIATSLFASEDTRARIIPGQVAAKSARTHADNGRRIFLESVTFDPVFEIPDFRAVGLPAGPDTEYGIVQFESGSLDEKANLERKGVRFVGYLPDNAFQVRLDAHTRALLASDETVRWFDGYEPGYKVSQRLWPGSDSPGTEITITVFDGEDINDVAGRISRAFPDAWQVDVIDDGAIPRARFAVPRALRDDFVKGVSIISAVSWMEPFYEPRILNDQASGVVQGDAAGAAGRALFARGITGTGQIVAVADSGLDSDMCFFRNLNGHNEVTDATRTIQPELGPLFPQNKVIAYWVQEYADPYDNNAICGDDGTPNSYHGTHTAGSAAGDNFSNPSSPTDAGVDQGDGMAPNAQILFQDAGSDEGCLSGLSNLTGTFEQAFLGGARIHSNSWGSDSNGAYTLSDRLIDRYVLDNEEMAIFVAAGNAGGRAGSVGSPANSKNGISVGALGSGASTSIARFSSRGPTADGRIKPDIVAPGSDITSASGNDTHGDGNCFRSSKSGTSMAAPIAAGAAALMRQYFTEGYYPTGEKSASDAFNPTATLLKAVLINGAHTLPENGILGSFSYGWGRVFLDNNLYFAGDARKLRVWNIPNAAGAKNGESHSYTVSVAEGEELRVTLVWTDPEAAPGAGQALVNDLDLQVTNGSSTWLGNVFDATGQSVTGGDADQLNNVEQVRFTAPAAGTYTITVKGTNIPGNTKFYTDHQGYALATSFATCSTAVSAAPTGLAIVNNPQIGVDLRWEPAPGSTSTQIYRADGSSPDSRQWQFVGSSTSGFFNDKRALSGKTYSYKLRGADGCGEGPASTPVSALATGGCDLEPDFAGLGTAMADSPNCSITLSWSAATPRCPTATSVSYNIYRSTDRDFEPGGAPIATAIDVTSFVDTQVANAVTYYYVVRAEDNTGGGSGPHSGNEDRNDVRIFATTFGPPIGSGTWTEDGGDTASFMAPEYPWHVTSQDAQSGSSAYFAGVDGLTYPALTCGAVTTPSLQLQPGAQLTYWARYNLEFQWDGVVVEISDDGGLTWDDLPPAGGYPDRLSETLDPPINTCGYPDTTSAFTGPEGNAELTAWTQYTSSLSGYADKTVRIRWRFTTDPGAEYEGFYLDSISITNVALPGECLPAVSVPRADFSVGSRSPIAGSTVSFTDASVNSPTSWLWNFGDSSTSSEQNPTHVFAAPGRYTVSLTATNQAGQDTASSEVVIFDGSLSYAATQIAPAQARLRGAAGSFFKTALWATNLAPTETYVQLRFIQTPGTSNGGAVETALLAVRPGESVYVENLLEDVFGATKNTGGAVVVEPAAGKPMPLVTTRTYNEPGASSGTFGQYTPPVNLSSAATDAIWIDGLGNDTAFRTNVGVVNLSSGTISATITVFDTTGTQQGHPYTLSVPSHASLQINGVADDAVTGAGTLSVFSVRVTANGPFFVYASKLDNVTSDPVYISGDLPVGSTLWIDAVAATKGIGAFFRSSLAIGNHGATEADVKIEYTPTAFTVPVGSKNVTLAPGESLYYADAVTELFGVKGKGTFKITTDPSTPVSAWSRTYNDRGVSGTLGQFIPAFGAEDLLGTAGGILQGISQNDSYRTNAGIINTTPTKVTVKVEAFQNDGTKLGEKTYPVEGRQAIFIALIVNDIVPDSTMANGYLRFTPSASDAIYIWAGYVDNLSTDPTFVRPILIQ